MAADRDGELPRVDDPFLAEDPQAYEREKRRLEREARRRERQRRSSLAARVGEALDGAGERGREILAEGRDRVRNPQPEESGPAPPPLRGGRRTQGAAPPPGAARRPDTTSLPDTASPDTASPPDAGGRLSAEEAMPRRPSRRPAPPALDPGSAQEAGEAGQRGGAGIEAPGAGSGEVDAAGAPQTARAGGTQPSSAGAVLAGGTDDWAPPPTSPHERGGAGGTDPGSRSLWVRRIVALAGLLALILAAAFAIGKLSGGEEAPPPPKGPAKLKTFDLTIPEGYTRSQMAALAKEAGLKGDYEKASAKAPKGFSLAKAGAPKDATLEGFLFPATYNLEKGAGVKDLIGQQLTAFEDNMSEINMRRAKRKNLTVYDVVTIASMIEREVQVPKERPLVAAVIYNRLAQNIPLGIDATLRYELDNFDEPLKQSELDSDTPYNTRINPGLPPTPIANPGRASLEAAAKPANADYLYYVVKPGTCGKHYFTDDYDDFLAASQEYQTAREAEGGSPTDC